VRDHAALRLAKNPRLAGLLLVLFFTRALIPIGYMLGPAGLMLCPGYAPTASTGDAELHDMSGMHMSGASKPMDHGGKAPLHESMGICPFAATATAFALLHVPTATAFALVVQGGIKSAPRLFIARTTVPPTRLPRGPPAIA
jgi:hypothetical protein